MIIIIDVYNKYFKYSTVKVAIDSGLLDQSENAFVYAVK